MKRVYKAQNREAWTIRLVLIILIISSLVISPTLYFELDWLDLKGLLMLSVGPFLFSTILILTIVVVVFRNIDLTREVLFSEHSLRADSRKMSITINYCDIIEVCICRRRRNNRILQIIVSDEESSITLSFFKEFDEMIALLKEQLSEEQFTEIMF